MPAVTPAWCRAITRQPALVELKLSLLAAVFVALEGPRRCGFSSQGAYAREALGMSAPSFSRRRRVGIFLLHSRAARAGLLSGAFGFGALELLLRRVPCGSADELVGLLPGKSLGEIEATLEAMAAPATEPEADPPPDPAPAHEETPQLLRLRMPEPLARLLQQNQQLAAQLCGELDEANANAMWIAEAAAESPTGDLVDNPWRVLGLRRPGMRSRARREGGIRVDLPAPRRLRAHRRKLEQIDRQLVALAQQHRRARSTMRDQLYELYQDKAWLSLGYTSAEAFADAELGLTARAWWQAIDDARRRARNDPVAHALAAGEIGDWVARRLHAFQRSAHIGASGMQAWVAAARELSCVALQERIDLARQWARFEARNYALRGWPVPTDEDLRAPERSLEQLVEAPDLPTEQALLASRHVEVELELHPSSRDELLSMWVALHQQRKLDNPDSSPWTALLILLARARLGMLQLALAGDEPARAAIHWRDGWRCANPACGSHKRLHSHHIHPLGLGGPDTPENQITLCEYCHLYLLHKGLLRITGRAGDPDRPLRFEMSFDERGRARRIYEGHRRVQQVA